MSFILRRNLRATIVTQNWLIGADKPSASLEIYKCAMTIVIREYIVCRYIEVDKVMLVHESNMLRFVLISNNNVTESSTHFDALSHHREK